MVGNVGWYHLRSRLHAVGLEWPVDPGCIGLALLVLVRLSLLLEMGALGAHVWG
jgi:hypothetical protein